MEQKYIHEYEKIRDNQPSLCIPHVLNNITEKKIYQVFEQLQIGHIKRIDIIIRENERSQPYKRVFIHFNKWYKNKRAIEIRSRLISGKDIKVVYDNPWFWKISVNRWCPIKIAEIEEQKDKIDKYNNDSKEIDTNIVLPKPKLIRSTNDIDNINNII